MFTIVAELVVTIGPIAQVGCASACSGVTSREVGPRAPAERAAGRGDDEPRHLVEPAAAQALGQRRVLGVDGDDAVGGTGSAAAGGAGGLDHERPADDERLLVGQRQGRAGAERGQGGTQADRAGHAVEDDVGAVPGDLDDAVLAAHDLGDAPAVGEHGDGGGELVDDVLARDGDGLDAELDGLAGEQVDVATARGERDHPEPVGGAADDVDRLGADRPRGPEQHDVSHAPIITDGAEPADHRHRAAGRPVPTARRREMSCLPLFRPAGGPLACEHRGAAAGHTATEGSPR